MPFLNTRHTIYLCAGGNLSDTSSCNDSASAAELVTTYNLLANCSARIQAACAQPQPNDSSTEDLLGNCKTEVDSLNTAAAGENYSASLIKLDSVDGSISDPKGTYNNKY